MKAIRLHAKGGPEQLIYEEAPLPVPAEGEVRIRVHAAGITPTELAWAPTYEFPDGSVRLPSIPAHEVAGTIDLLGPGVAGLTVGEPVFGLIDFPRDGCAAEYTVVPATDIAPKPRSKDYVQAAAVPLSALTAWQALVDHAKLRPGQRVLIHGGAGGVGSFAVQIAKFIGAHVLATASKNNGPFVRKLGAEEVIDYSKNGFYETLNDLDVVLDTVGGEALARSWSMLKPAGVIVSIVSEPKPTKGNENQVRGVFFIVKPNRSQLNKIGSLLDSGHIRPVIDSVFPLAQARKAFEKGLQGHNRGKLVLHVAN